jgi:hypothetical protein
MDQAAREEATVAPLGALDRAPAVLGATTAVDRVLALQRSAGNAAVGRALQRRALARDSTWPPGKDDQSGYWKDQTPAELGRRVADDLLADPKYRRLAAVVLAGSWIKVMVDSVEVIRQKGLLKELEDSSAGYGPVQYVAALVRDPIGFDSAATLAKIGGGVPDDQVKQADARRIDLALTQFAFDRGKLSAALAKESAEGARKTALDALRAYDAKQLPGLEKLTANRGPSRWQHDDVQVEDALVAAMGLRAADAGLTDLDRPNAEVAQRARTGHGAKENWCGFFATDQYRGASFDARAEALAGSFASTYRVKAFFTYQYGAITGLFPKWIRAEDGSWQELAKYHDARHARRKWTTTQELKTKKLDELDILPGDIVTIAVVSKDERDPTKDDAATLAKKESEMNHESGYGDHIVMALSYDKKTGRLFTIGGNDGGYVVRTAAPPANESPSAKADREAREAITGKQLQTPTDFGGHVGVGFQDLAHQAATDPVNALVTHGHISAVGRPSIVDFETHEYSDDGVTVKTKDDPSPKPKKK